MSVKVIVSQIEDHLNNPGLWNEGEFLPTKRMFFRQETVATGRYQRILFTELEGNGIEVLRLRGPFDIDRYILINVFYPDVETVDTVNARVMWMTSFIDDLDLAVTDMYESVKE